MTVKTIIAGSRGVDRYQEVSIAVAASGFEITEVVSGGARGVDKLGECWAEQHKIPIKQFLPDWNANGKAAGHIRNRQMGDYADALIAIWDGESRGTKGMIDYAKAKGLKVFVLEQTIHPSATAIPSTPLR